MALWTMTDRDKQVYADCGTCADCVYQKALSDDNARKNAALETSEG